MSPGQQRPKSVGARSKGIQGGSGWMLTFADLLSLLLTFFVLLFSMSTVEFESWKAVVSTMADEFNVQRPKLELQPQVSPDAFKPSKGAGLNLNYLQVLLERAIADRTAFEGVIVHREEDRVLVSIPAAVLFEHKDAQLATDALVPLKQLAGTLVQIRNKIRIAGHTDTAPNENVKFRSNWELSLTRARIIAGILTDFGYREPITVLGYADTQADELDKIGPDAESLGLAERIDIVIMAEGRRKDLYDLF